MLEIAVKRYIFLFSAVIAIVFLNKDELLKLLDKSCFKKIGYYSSNNHNENDLLIIKESLKEDCLRLKKIKNSNIDNLQNIDQVIVFNEKDLSYIKKNLPDKTIIFLRADQSYQDDSKNVKTIYENNNPSLLISLIQEFKLEKNILIVYAADCKKSKIDEIKHLLKTKNVNFTTLLLDKTMNASSAIKKTGYNFSACIILDSEQIQNKSENLINIFLKHKIPIFSNNIENLHNGALAGYAIDTIEIVNFIKKVYNNNLYNYDFTSQLHINMNTLKQLKLKIADDIIEDAITITGEDL